MKNLCVSCALICLMSLSAMAHDHRAYPFVAPAVVAPATMVVPIPVARPVPLDHLLAALETSEELRILLSNTDRLNQLAADPLALRFLRERLTHRDVATTAGLSPEYVIWLYETLTAYGNRLDPTLVIPNFRLYPSQNTASWSQIYARSFQPIPAMMPTMVVAPPVVTTEWLARITTSHPHAHIHLTPDPRAQKIARPPAGSIVTVLAESGDWYMVRTATGVVGYAHKYEMTAVQTRVDVSVMSIAGSTIAWQPEGGRDTPYGWVYPRSTQHIETFSR